jgi:uncharacterized protein (TIGR03083 family)
VDLWEAAELDVRPTLPEERKDLLDFLAGLTRKQWLAPSAAPGWTVKDLALHLLDDDLGWLSRGRDNDQSSLLVMSDHASFVEALAAKNQMWVEGARGLSLPVVRGLLAWTGEQMDAYYASLDLRSEGRVSWASDGPVPIWFDIAQDLTERWVHQQQMREAVGQVRDYADKYLPLVLRTFIWALPHQYRPVAAEGTIVTVDVGHGGVWSLYSDGRAVWHLDEGGTAVADARIVFSDDAAWRWLTGAAWSSNQIVQDGPEELLEPMLRVRSIIV